MRFRMTAAVALLLFLLVSTGALAQSSPSKPNPFENLFGGAGQMSPGGRLGMPQGELFGGTAGGETSARDALASIEMMVGMLKTMRQIVPDGLGPGIRNVPCPNLFDPRSLEVSVDLIDGITDAQGILAEFPRFKRLAEMLKEESRHFPCLDQAAALFDSAVLTLEGRAAEGDAIAIELLPPLGAGVPLHDLLHALRGQALVLQNRYDELDRILKLITRAVVQFGDRHHFAIAVGGARGDLAFLQGRYEDARQLYAAQGAAAADRFGSDHVLVCLAKGGEARAAFHAGAVEEAATLFEAVLKPDAGPCAVSLSQDHPWRGEWHRELGSLYLGEGDLKAADSHLTSALRLLQISRGERHPETIQAQMVLAELRAEQGRIDDAIALIDDMNTALLSWLGNEVWGTTSRELRRRLVGAQRQFQELALLIALENPRHNGAQETAARAVLRFKGLQAEEEAALERLTRSPTVAPEIRNLARAVQERRTELATLFRLTPQMADVPQNEIERRTKALDEAEASLARASRTYRARRSFLQTVLSDVQAALRSTDRPSVLVEFLRYLPRPERRGGKPSSSAGERWAAVVIAANSIRSVDLGSVKATEQDIRLVLENTGDFVRVQMRLYADLCASHDAISARLFRVIYGQLIAPLELPEDHVAILSPDHVLGLLPFAALCTPNGRHWIEEQPVALTQTGRALIEREGGNPAGGFVGFGGIDFGTLAASPEADQTPRVLFKEISHSLSEVRGIEALVAAHTQEPRTLFTGTAADKEALYQLKEAPRILHLATHGFYSGSDDWGLEENPSPSSERLLVQSGIALAGANARDGKGVMRAIEVQNLNLEGTEVAVLSACSTALGFAERNEGIHGLTRAFRIAGAENVLVALRPVGDRDARDLMVLFYENWLSEPSLSPTEAFERTIRHILAEEDINIDWSAFILYRG